MTRARLLICDSGLGGLSVASAIRADWADVDMIYAADYAAFPYGEQPAKLLHPQILKQYSSWIDAYKPDAVVIACNTASTLILPSLREAYTIPIVGIVPAIKPAAKLSQSGHISILATPGTVSRDYTKALLDQFASRHQVRLVGSASLAQLAEDWIIDGPSDAVQEKIRAQVLPCFHDSGQDTKTDCIALACTHYPLIMGLLADIAPWPVTWIDPSAAIARQVKAVLENRAFQPGFGTIEFVSSSGQQQDRLAIVWERLMQLDTKRAKD
ncbi:MAG: glutamate racemase [Hyphomicrobiales bacterium]|nr:MAG: glutamate racemase [Hyphomicrobiales bacterium]